MIDEKKLIEDIHAYFRKKLDEDESEIIDNDILTLNKEICGIIKNQPKVGEWIPCSEMLPEEGEMVLVTQKVYGGNMVCVCSYESAYGYGCGFYGSSGDVVAWMPLPEPYKGVD